MPSLNIRGMISSLMEISSEPPNERDSSAETSTGSGSPLPVDASWPPPAHEAPSALISAPVLRGRKTRKILAVMGLLLVPVSLIVLGIGLAVRLPYVIFSPGRATPVAPIVKIEGARSFPTRADLLFLTVSVSNQRPNVWRYLQASLSSENTVVPEANYLGGSTPQRDLAINQILMTESQEDAKAAALRYLGYRVPVTGAGAIVAAVTPGGPSVGELQVGDLITAINAKQIQRSDEVGLAVRAMRPGTEFVFAVTRTSRQGSKAPASSEIEVRVVSRLAQSGELKGKPFIGIAPATKDLRYEFPIDISIDPGAVSGPSAGLAFALTIIDELTPGSLPGARDVAVTGTISSDGVVGAVGGVRQKSRAACSAGARLMLVPVGEEKEASGLKCSGMRILGVRSLKHALLVLANNGGGRIPQRAVQNPAPAQ